MPETWSLDSVWWITAVELPALAGLFWLSLRTRRDTEAAIDKVRTEVDERVSRLRDNLAAYKLEVAKSYASITYLKEVERRLTSHLLRIEDKLDRAGSRKEGEA